jgi:hypothetical protein
LRERDWNTTSGAAGYVISSPVAEAEMDIKALQSQFLGDILTPDSKEYETSRRIWSGMIDRRTPAIARCSNRKMLGPRSDLLSIRRSIPRSALAGIMSPVSRWLTMDLTRMKGIYVDLERRTATAQTGLTWGEFDRETQLYGLATTGSRA